MKNLVEYINEGLKGTIRRFKEKYIDSRKGFIIPEKHLDIRVPFYEELGGKYQNNTTPVICKQIKNIVEKYTKIKPYNTGEHGLLFTFDLSSIDVKTIDKIFDDIYTTYSKTNEVVDNSDNEVKHLEIRVENEFRKEHSLHYSQGDIIYEYIYIVYRYEVND